ncbi:MAG TPA: flippase-like domain-containing protein [Chloroflexi bacterium]|nr:flippase-like domain-containing protein [Chloroflexota bacterium]
MKLTFQRIVYLLLAAAFVYAIYEYHDQLVDIVTVLREGVWYFVLATLAVLGLAIYNQATLYASIYRTLELPSEKRDLLPLYLIRRFVTVAAPSGGFSGWVPFLEFARRRELAIGTVFIANLIYTILWYSTFGIFLLLGLLYLFLSHDLQWFEISAALVMLVADVIMIIGLILAWVAPGPLESILHRVAHAIERVSAWLKRPAPLTDAQMTTFVNDLSQAITQMRRAGWRRLLIPVGHALLNETLNLLMFYLIARAFGETLNFGVLVAAYSISVLFFVVSPTPGGLGFVEGTLILVLTTLRVPAHSATVVTLAYRGITFWLPFVLGFLALRWIRVHPVPEQ